MSGHDQVQIKSVEEMMGRFTSELVALMPDWKNRLSDDPQQLESLEKTVHQSFARGADMLVAGLIAVVMTEQRLSEATERTRQQFSRPLDKGQERTVRIRLFGGLLFLATVLYCPPKKKRFHKDDQVRVGLHATLAQFGFGKGVSPALQTRVARRVALCPSIRFAQQELQRDGVDLDAKAVQRITYQCGEGLLQLRRHQIELWRAGELPAGEEVAGKRVSVQIDGGRIKIRGNLQPKTLATAATDADGLLSEDAPGRSRGESSRTFDADWREPKLVTIFVHDDLCP